MLSDETFDCITAKLPKMVEKCVNTIAKRYINTAVIYMVLFVENPLVIIRKV